MKRRHSGTVILREIRRKKMGEVRARYARHGDAVVQRMLQFSLKPHGLRQVLRKLSLRNAGPSETQAHEKIISYIQERGADQFLVSLRSGAEFVPPPVSAPSMPMRQAPAPAQDSKPVQDAGSEKDEAAKEKQAGAAQRRHPRFESDFEVTAFIKPNEESASCFESVGRIRDVSALGLCLVVPNLPKRWYAALCKSRGYVEIGVRMPNQNQKSKISGTIAWMDFHGDEAQPFCRIGVDLGRSDEVSKAVVQNLVILSQ